MTFGRQRQKGEESRQEDISLKFYVKLIQYIIKNIIYINFLNVLAFFFHLLSIIILYDHILLTKTKYFMFFAAIGSWPIFLRLHFCEYM